ncbi:MAG TPA: DeoR/GlpR family DNA-binding transcription regulator [Candidatus Limnocylindrales bacterium]|jgi:DeoR/GlpR family transcriptional regulator of sugar metabolism|nr:DeoR/GlpR family DNA-binding transcription regulator [Candidatus Limnocylindrales bacterium]
MLARQRQALILDRVRQTGAVRVAELARDLGVSDMTVRRDLEVLHEHGLIEKVHGGATALSGLASFEPGFVAKSALQQAEKAAIAAAAAELVEPGMAIGISAGTTTHALAARVADVPGVTIVTNSIRVADVLHRAGRRDQTVILTGGTRTPSEALVGSFAVSQLRSVHLDQVFMGVHGMDAKAGFTCPNLHEAETDRALIDAGRRLVVLADHTKWGVIGIASIGALDQADVLISDESLPPEARSLLADVVGELVLVGVGEPSGVRSGAAPVLQPATAAGRAH